MGRRKRSRYPELDKWFNEVGVYADKVAGKMIETYRRSEAFEELPDILKEATLERSALLFVNAFISAYWEKYWEKVREKMESEEESQELSDENNKLAYR